MTCTFVMTQRLELFASFSSERVSLRRRAQCVELETFSRILSRLGHHAVARSLSDVTKHSGRPKQCWRKVFNQRGPLFQGRGRIFGFEDIPPRARANSDAAMKVVLWTDVQR